MRIIIKLLILIAAIGIMVGGSFLVEYTKDINSWLHLLIALVTVVSAWIPVIFGLYVIDAHYRTLDEELQAQWIDTIDSLIECYSDEYYFLIDSFNGIFEISDGEGKCLRLDYDFTKTLLGQSEEIKKQLLAFIKQ